MKETAFYDIHSILGGVKLLAPQEFAKLNCKIYKKTDSFADHRVLLANLAVAQRYTEEPLILQMPVFDKQMAYLQAITAQNLVKYNVPTYFVEPEMLKSCLNTEPPAVVDWSSMNLPFETGIFIFPKNFLLFPDGTECGHLLWSRLEKGMYSFKFDQMKFDEKSFLTLTSSYAGYNFHRLLNKPFEPEAPMELFDFIESKREKGELLKLSGSEKDFELKLNNLLFNLLLVMTMRETLVKKGERVGRHKKQQLEIWTPNIFGQNYRVQREYEAQNFNRSGIKQKYHWRSGHWKTQHFGQGNQFSKRIWIEPYMVL